LIPFVTYTPGDKSGQISRQRLAMDYDIDDIDIDDVDLNDDDIQDLITLESEGF